MRLFACLFIVSLLAFPTAFAIEPSPGEIFAKKVANTENWNKFLAGLQASLNPLVTKELTVLTKDLPFPSMSVRKGSLIISNENGEHMNIMFFKKNGAVTMNGKEWVLRPLATPEAEVKRISEMLGGAHTSLFDLIEASAHAGGLMMTTSVAAAAYASAASWKGEACAKGDLNKEQINSCTLMAVAMEGPAQNKSSNGLLPISYKCPKENNGTLELISKSPKGISTKLEIPFPPNKSKNVLYSFSESGSTFAKMLDADPDSDLEPKMKTRALFIKEQGDVLQRDVCLGSREARLRFDEMLASNRTTLSTSARTDDSPSEKKSSSGL